MSQHNKTGSLQNTNEQHSVPIQAVKDSFPPAKTLEELAELFRVFGDYTRIRILFALFEHEICVCHLAELLDMSVSAVSHQLRTLKTAGLVKYRRDGKTCFYSLLDDHVKTIIAQGLDHITEETP